MENSATLYEPKWPTGCPDAVKEKWLKEFSATVTRRGNEGASILQEAMRNANQTVLAVEAPENYESALRLESWQIVKRSIEENGALRLLKFTTIDGQKFLFPLPAGSDLKLD